MRRLPRTEGRSRRRRCGKCCASLPKRSVKPPRGLQQDRVAAGIAEAGMNGLEAVEIQQRQLRACQVCRPVSPWRPSAPRALPSPVSGSRGGRRRIFLAVGDVAHQAQAVGRHILLGDDGGAQFQPAPDAALAPGRGIPGGRPDRAGRETSPAHRDRSRGLRDGAAPSSRNATGSLYGAGRPSISAASGDRVRSWARKSRSNTP